MTREKHAHTLWTHARIATMAADANVPYGLLDDAALATSADGTIAWVGAAQDVPPEVSDSVSAVRDVAGRLVTPGFVDCHTHLVHAGNRAREFEMRLAGAHYDEIARAGGGILSTVRATRATGDDALAAQSAPRLAALARSGVTTIEIKSGYGLDRETELKMLATARVLGERSGIRVRTTYLALHAIPPEFPAADAYVDFVIEQMLPAIKLAGLADAVDAFCESIAFSAAETARFFEAARALGFAVKLHADQLSDGGGAELAARYDALSADHLEYASAAGLAALARAGTVAVLLPAATYFLGESRRPPIDQLRALGIPIAIASDCNPGTAPLVSMPLTLNMACTVLRLTPEEALAGATRNAARALGLAHRVGTLEAGRVADFVLWDLEHPAELAYTIGASVPHAVVLRGKIAGDVTANESGR